MQKAAEYTPEEKIAAIAAIFDYTESMRASEGDRTFVARAAGKMLAGKADDMLLVTLDTVAAHLVGEIDSAMRDAGAAVRTMRRKARHAAIEAKGLKVCGRCSGTGEFINGGECWGCDGKGGKA